MRKNVFARGRRERFYNYVEMKLCRKIRRKIKMF